MAFLRHLPCPDCGSRDNLAEYSEAFYCFGCGKKTNKNDNASLRERIENTRSNSKICENIITSAILPIEAEKWLAQYGLTKEEKSLFSWCEEKKLLILIQTQDYWQGRNFGIGAKYLSSGIKPLKFYGVESDTIVFTEDVISAIKVGRFVKASPLLGATLPIDTILNVIGEFKNYYLALDYDKAKESVKQAKKAAQYLGKCGSIITELDLKCYNNSELQTILKERGILL